MFLMFILTEDKNVPMKKHQWCIIGEKVAKFRCFKADFPGRTFLETRPLFWRHSDANDTNAINFLIKRPLHPYTD